MGTINFSELVARVDPNRDKKIAYRFSNGRTFYEAPWPFDFVVSAITDGVDDITDGMDSILDG